MSSGIAIMTDTNNIGEWFMSKSYSLLVWRYFHVKEGFPKIIAIGISCER